ncbi:MULTISPECIES: acyltransferase family protein [Methylotenera]|uniref:acyltransferase family protein n=1 Tax=Methylotenera TaxID=359407 RepID=UPI00039B5392|nr:MULTISPECIES: acyltransferase [Methylotenera]
MVFLNYMNAFRALTIFLIVAVHTVLVFSWDNNLSQQNALNIIYGNSTTLFMFISGYLFQHLLVKFNTKRYYFSKLKYVLLPYFVISLPIILYYVLVAPKSIVNSDFLAQPAWLQFLNYYWWGIHLYPMWFMPVIAMFYLAGPLLKWGDRNNLIYWLLPFFILMSFLIGRSLFPYFNFLHFLSVYVFGMLCCKYKNLINPFITKYSVLAILISTFLCLYALEFYEVFPQFTAINYVQKLFLILVLLGLMIKFERHTKHQLISIIANTSFGVYFVHTFVLVAVKFVSSYINNQFSMNSSTKYYPGNPLLHFVVTCIALTLSILLVLAIKKVLGDKTYILIGNIPATKSASK